MYAHDLYATRVRCGAVPLNIRVACLNHSEEDEVRGICVHVIILCSSRTDTAGFELAHGRAANGASGLAVARNRSWTTRYR